MKSEKQNEKPSRKTTTSGGINKIEVIEEYKVPIAEAVAEGLGEPEPEPSGEEVSPEMAAINEILIESSAKMIGKTVELLTRIPEMNFDEVEIEQLKTAWSPLLPTISPLLAAIVITTTIVSGKVAIYITLRKKIPEKIVDRKKKEGISEKTTE